MVGHDRPGYGGSTPQPGRTVGAAAGDVAAVADSLGIERFAVLGHSGGGPHALACGALLGDRVLAVVSASGPAPYDAEDLAVRRHGPGSLASLEAARGGRAIKERYEEPADAPPSPTAPDAGRARRHLVVVPRRGPARRWPPVRAR